MPETHDAHRTHPIPLPATPASWGVDLIWHYTNAQGLLGILKSDQLWATSTEMLNDGRELTHGLGLIGYEATSYLEDELLSDVQKEFVRSCFEASSTTMLSSKLFVICASLVDDSLSQWRGYAGTGGYAIGLDPTASLRIAGQHGRMELAENQSPGWRLVMYGEDEIDDQARTLLDHLVSTAPQSNTARDSDEWREGVRMGALALNLTVPWIKHEGFADEREVRWAFTQEGLFEPRLRTNSLGVVPYFAVAADVEPTSETGVTQAVSKLPIREIMIGPCPYPEAASRGLKTALELLGYGDVEITLSGVPYR